MSLSPAVRLVSNDASYVSLQDVYDQHCEEIGITREDPILMVGEKMKQALQELTSMVSARPHLLYVVLNFMRKAK